MRDDLYNERDCKGFRHVSLIQHNLLIVENRIGYSETKYSLG